MDKFTKLFFILLSVYSYVDSNNIFDNEFSNEISPLMATNETLIQNFNCNTGSKLRELDYSKYFETKISCNDWVFKKLNTSFNITIDDKVESLELMNMNTFWAHVNGHLILVQRGPITEGICAGGSFDKLVFNMVDPLACDGKGVAIQNTLYASVRIIGGYCEAFCLGQVYVKFDPAIRNWKFTPKD